MAVQSPSGVEVMWRYCFSSTTTEPVWMLWQLWWLSLDCNVVNSVLHEPVWSHVTDWAQEKCMCSIGYDVGRLSALVQASFCPVEQVFLRTNRHPFRVLWNPWRIPPLSLGQSRPATTLGMVRPHHSDKPTSTASPVLPLHWAWSGPTTVISRPPQQYHHYTENWPSERSHKSNCSTATVLSFIWFKSMNPHIIASTVLLVIIGCR